MPKSYHWHQQLLVMHWKNWKNFRYFVLLVVAVAAAVAVEAVGVATADAAVGADAVVGESEQKNTKNCYGIPNLFLGFYCGYFIYQGRPLESFREWTNSRGRQTKKQGCHKSAHISF